MENMNLNTTDTKNSQTNTKKVWQTPALVEINKATILAKSAGAKDSTLS